LEKEEEREEIGPPRVLYHHQRVLAVNNCGDDRGMWR
jgi:hypothetical protein